MRLLILLFFGDFVRIGEATNPGPQLETSAPDSFVLGCFNPSGLRSKSHFVSTHLAHGDIWAISETHLTGRDAQQFRKGLRCSQSKFKYFVTGHPVGPQATCSQSWKGVGLLSCHPTRAIPNNWPSEIFRSSRAMLSTTLLDDVWLTGGTIYGEPDGHLYPDRKYHNEQLLRHVAGQLCHLCVGPRFLAGDLNELIDSLPSFDILRAAGFQELQDLALARWGCLIQPTCKQTTRKDFCFVSPELAALLQSVRVRQDIWPDHAVLEGVFKRLSSAPPRQIWPTPSDLPWPKQFCIDPAWWQVDTTDPTGQYAQLWHVIEQSAAAKLPFHVQKHQTGRAATLQPRVSSGGKIAPVKSARLGDFQPNFHGVSVRHAQWIRQVRRLQSYMRHMSDKTVADGHAIAVWGSICRAKGFCPSFPDWWIQASHATPNAPAACPALPPGFLVAQAMFESMALAVRALEKDLAKSSRQYARMRRANNPNVIFQDIKVAPAQGVELLCQPLVATVISVNHDDSSITLDQVKPWRPDLPIVSQGAVLEVIHSDGDCIWVEHLDHLACGAVVSQTLCKGSTDELAADFLQVWGARWQRHADVPSSRWMTIIQFAQDRLPHGSLSWPDLDVAALREAIIRKKTTTASGLDGVTSRDLRAMPDSALSNFCRIFATAEQSGSWPQQMIDGRVTSLAKTSEPQSASDFRPITVLGLLYRCFGSHHARHAVRSMEHLLPDNLYGSRPGCHAAQLWAQILWAIEFSFEHDIQLSGLIADIQKAFNHLPREVVVAVCLWLGFPFPVVKAWSGAMASFQRRFSIRGCVSAPIDSCTGYPEGDALSCVAMVCIDLLYHAWMQHLCPLCQPMSFVDDWQILTCHPSSLPEVRTHLHSFVHEVDLLLDTRKTFAWALCPQARAELKTQGFVVELDCRNLGAQCQMSRRHSNKVQTERLESLTELWPKLRMSACRYEDKVRAIHTAAWPKGLHAIAATTVSLAHFHSLRTGAMKGLHADGAGCNAFVHLGLVQVPSTDPHFYAIMSTFRLVRACASHAEVRDSMIAMSKGLSSCPDNSVTFTLLTRVHCLSWHVDDVGRSDLPADVERLIVSLPESLTCYGWSLRPWTQLQWWQYCASLESPAPVFLSESLDVVHLFTDGSCYNQHVPGMRFASWSVVLAGTDTSGCDSFLLDSGPLPGLLQSAFRAEIFAILRAILAAGRHAVRVMLWTDCESVLWKLQAILRGETPSVNAPHADLWLQVFQAVHDLPPGSVSVNKVLAHQDGAGDSPLEDWCFLHNRWADRAAVRANFTRPRSFWDLVRAHELATSIACHISRSVQNVLLRISRAVLQSDSVLEPEGEPPVLSTAPPAEAWLGLNTLVVLPGAAARWYGQPLVCKILSWWFHSLHGETGQCLWVSHFQLYLDFQMSTGFVGPIHAGKWQDGDDQPLVGLLNHPFRLRARWFAKMLKECLRHLNQSFTYRFMTPHSTVLNLHTGCLALPWPLGRLDKVDNWIVSKIPAGIRRKGTSLDTLPIANRDESFPVVPLSSCGF
eukprot:s2_g21.t1